ncbi:MAG TPA: NAD-dependent epimerase/dehydratase family protein [Candidatus Margulisiibacteriota bacterium]|nr:NAD-dependent epimerase/dehydratase family protein [Candidatus Margulisiibacteriota bacterium]
MKALVTGASGFLGRSIVRRLLRDGIEVRALMRPGRRFEIAGVELAEGDICDDAAVAAAVRGVDWVVHAAARVATTGSWEEFAEVNVRGTRRLIRAAVGAGVQRIVHISSLSIYAVSFDGVTITEDAPYESEAEARGGYSRSKLAADRAVLAAARCGAPVVVLRPGLLYGPGKRPPVARQSFGGGRVKLLLATPHYTLPLSYVDNVADAVLLAARCDAAAGEAFTIVDANVEQAHYLSLYRAASGETWRAVFLPVGAVALAALLAEGGLRMLRRRSPVTYHQVRRATQSARYDCSRAERVLGWRPSVSVEEGLRRVFASLQNPASRTSTPALAGVIS